MKTITLLNEKGGVGKTTLSVHIAAGLAIMGKRVLLIDADAQAHSTHQLQIKESPGLYDLLVRDATWKDIIRVPESTVWAGGFDNEIGKLMVLPSNVETRSIMSSMGDDVLYLRECISELDSSVDVVVIDTSPTPSLLHSMIYLATDYIVFPAQPEILSLDGLGKSVTRMTGQNRMRESMGVSLMEMLGVQPTMVAVNTNAHRYGLGRLRQHFGDALIWDPIPMATIWRDAGYARQTLYAYAPEHDATYRCWAICDRIMAALKGVASVSAA